MLNQDMINAMRQQLKTGVQVVSAPQLFPTPRELAERIADEADIQPHHRILEPQAGTGMLIGAIVCAWYPDGFLQSVEINADLCTRLRQEFPLTEVLQADFLQCTPSSIGYFDRIIMNPPFSNGADIIHIQHAYRFLSEDGRLLGVCANGPRQQKILAPMAEESGGYYEPLPAGTFTNGGTNVNTAILVIDGK